MTIGMMGSETDAYLLTQSHKTQCDVNDLFVENKRFNLVLIPLKRIMHYHSFHVFFLEGISSGCSADATSPYTRSLS